MAKRGLLMLGGVFLIAVAGMIFINDSYFFNPLTFRQSAVTPFPWRWYKNPLEIEYAVLDDDGWKMCKIADREEIHLVFRELQKSVHTVKTGGALPGEGRQIWFGVRRQTDGAILLSINGWEQTNSCQLEEDTVITLTERLQDLLQARVQEARSRTAEGQRKPAET